MARSPSRMEPAVRLDTRPLLAVGTSRLAVLGARPEPAASADTTRPGWTSSTSGIRSEDIAQQSIIAAAAAVREHVASPATSTFKPKLAKGDGAPKSGNRRTPHGYTVIDVETTGL